MASFLTKLKEMFISKEKKFTLALLEELENKNFVNLKKISSRLPLQQRYNVVNKLQASKKLFGLLIPERMLFLSIDDDNMNTLKSKVKDTGKIEINELKERWKLKDNILENVLQQIELGIMGDKTYFTHKYIQNFFASNLRDADEYDLLKMSSKLGLEFSKILPLIEKMINENILFGVIKNQQFFINSETFENLLSEYLEELDESVFEMEFSQIASDLGVSSSVITKYLVNHVEKNPGRFVVYPLEKKIRIKR